MTGIMPVSGIARQWMLHPDAPRPQPDAPRPPIVTDDAYDLRTPEQIDLQYDLAGLGSRFMAMALDTLIQGAVMFALVVVFGVGAALLTISLRDLIGRNSGVLRSSGLP